MPRGAHAHHFTPAAPIAPTPQNKEQSARRVLGTFAALLAVAALTIGLFVTLVVLIARAKGFALFG